MNQNSHGRSISIALIAPDPVEQAQATWWRPLERNWPTFADPPTLRILGWGRARAPEEPLSADAALIVPRAGDVSGRYALLNRLVENLIPAVVMVDPGEPASSSEDLICLPNDCDPAIVAAILASLGSRQRAVNALRADVGVCRRFQGGLRGQIESMHEELQAAAAVQRRFMPAELPRVPGLDLEVLFRPCGYVSGDIYDAALLDEHRVGFFVADAVGHGVPAALMTIMLCRNLPCGDPRRRRAHALSPAQVLRHINDDLVQTHGEGSRFATAVYGVIDTRTGLTTLAGAGHPYPLRIRGSAVERVETPGGLLGVSADEQFTESSFVLEPDEMLVIYSDGFETAFPQPNADQYGRKLPNSNYIDRFVAAARSWREHGPARAVGMLLDEIDRQRGSLHQADDLTALLIARRPTAALDDLLAGRECPAAPKEPGSASLGSGRG